MRIVFLVAEPVNGDTEDRDEVQERLRGEAETRGDILQPSIEDGHRKLGYKILSGKWSEKLFARFFAHLIPNNLLSRRISNFLQSNFSTNSISRKKQSVFSLTYVVP